MTLNLQPATPERFAGREKEIKIFQELLKSEKDSLFIYGEAGIGKSSLIEKYKSLLDKDHLVVFLRAYEDNITVMDKLLLQLRKEFEKLKHFWEKIWFMEIGDKLDKAIYAYNEMKGLVRPEFPSIPSVPPMQRLDRFYESIDEVIVDFGDRLKDRRLFLFIDDLQNISEDERNIMMHFLKNRGRNMHYILTWRETDEPVPSDCERYSTPISLKDMSLDDYKKMIENEKDIETDEEGIKYANKILKGNPYYFIALLMYCKNNKKKLSKEMIDQKLPEGMDSIDNLHEDIYSRIPEFHDILKAGSILRKSFGINIMSFMLEKKGKEKDKIEEGLIDLEKRKILIKDGKKYNFPHSLFKDFIQRCKVMSEDKKAIHLRAAEFYMIGDIAEEMVRFMGEVRRKQKMQYIFDVDSEGEEVPMKEEDYKNIETTHRYKLESENLLEVHYHLKNAGKEEDAIAYVLKNYDEIEMISIRNEIIDLLEKAKEEIEDEDLYLRIIFELGSLSQFGFYSLRKGEKCMRKYIRIIEKSGDTKGLGSAYLTLGNILDSYGLDEEEGGKYSSNGNKYYEEAEKCYRKKLEIALKIGDEQEIEDTKKALAFFKENHNELDEALDLWLDLSDEEIQSEFFFGENPLLSLAKKFKKAAIDYQEKGEKERCTHDLKRANEVCRRLLRFPEFKDEAEREIILIEEIEKQL